MEDIVIEIESNFLDDRELLSILKDDLEQEFNDIDLFLLQKNDRGSSIDPTVLVALISTWSAISTALIIGIFKILEKKQDKKFGIEVEIEGKGTIKMQGSKELSTKEFVELAEKNIKLLRKIKIVEKPIII